MTITTRPIALTFFSGAIPGPLRGVVLGLSCGSSSTGPSGALAQYSRPCARSPFRAAAMDRSGGARASCPLLYRLSYRDRASRRVRAGSLTSQEMAAQIGVVRKPWR